MSLPIRARPVDGYRRLKQHSQMLTEDQKARIRLFALEFKDSLNQGQRTLIAEFWADMRPKLSPMQRMVVDAVLSVVE